MRIKMVSLEDGITSCGFRKMAAFVARINEDTESCYVSTNRYRNIRNGLRGTLGSAGSLEDEDIDLAARHLIEADVVGLSSMTGYAELTRRLITRVKELDPSTYVIWGGIHAIIQPEDAILADVDAICTGEGEFAFEELYGLLKEGRDPTQVKNFWFRQPDGNILKNHFLPLMSVEQMESLPFPQYGDGETIYETGEGFKPMNARHYIENDGLSYTTLWSIGCPFHCTYCGNTKFISNDAKYKRIRHPSARYIVDEVKTARARFPHLSHVSFHDDSFMAIPYREIEEFAELWKAELDLPFAVYGVIPNYVKRDKFELLTWAGMNRVRMGIQSGSRKTLEFYKRPSPPEKILAAGEVNASFAPKYHIPPAYDIITDNPVETAEDIRETLQLLYDMSRPYTLFIYSLKVIPNTELEQAMQERGIDIEEISATFMSIPPRLNNLMLYTLTMWRPPEWLWRRLLKHVKASTEEQRMYPRLGRWLRAMYLSRRALSHLVKLDFSAIPGRTGYYFWRLGLIGMWRKHMTTRLPRPPRPEKEIAREKREHAAKKIAA
ncbi:MAG TPA: radical SAM protein [Solirubrobacteraceae bacterium]|nr:radical SAM protein [Solirubrobacteraceae bacterium]